MNKIECMKLKIIIIAYRFIIKSKSNQQYDQKRVQSQNFRNRRRIQKKTSQHRFRASQSWEKRQFRKKRINLFHQRLKSSWSIGRKRHQEVLPSPIWNFWIYLSRIRCYSQRQNRLRKNNCFCITNHWEIQKREDLQRQSLLQIFDCAANKVFFIFISDNSPSKLRCKSTV